jgi:hypothetical protein
MADIIALAPLEVSKAPDVEALEAGEHREKAAPFLTAAHSFRRGETRTRAVRIVLQVTDARGATRCYWRNTEGQPMSTLDGRSAYLRGPMH